MILDDADFRQKGCYMSGMTNQARLASLDNERSKLMARIAKARSLGLSDKALIAQVRALSKERVDIAAA